MVNLKAYLQIILFALCLCSCKVEPSNVLVSDGSKSAICIKRIETVNLLSEEEGPDVIEIELYSTDDKLNQLLDSALIEKLTINYLKGDTLYNGDVTHSMRTKKLNEALYKLTYMTSYFINFPVDKVREQASDFLARL